MTRGRNQLIVYLFATLGLRVSQLIGIKMSDVWVENECLYIAIERKKDNSDVIVKEVKAIPMSHSIGRYAISYIYDKYLTLRSKYAGLYFFINNQGKMLSTNYIRSMLAKIGDVLGIDHVTPHAFRHFVGTYVANAHGITKAAVLLGHKNIRMTQKYINPDRVDTSMALPTW